MEWLDKAKDGTPGALCKVFGKIQMVKHCDRLVADLPMGTRTKTNLEVVVSKFRGYEACHEAFRYSDCFDARRGRRRCFDVR